MGKYRARSKRISILIIILLVIILISSLTTNVLIYLKNKDLVENNSKLLKEYATYNSKNADTNATIKKYEDEINKLNNIETDIQNIKETAFKSIKELEDKILSGEVDKKIAYLTFDDGPYYSTYQFLDVLDENNVKATFFTIGYGKEKCYDNRGKDCTPLYKEIVERGHTIANHTYSHSIWGGIYFSKEAFIEDLLEQEKLIQNYTGVKTNITRFPGGSATAGSVKQSIIEGLKSNNYGWVDWSAGDGDGGHLSSKEQAWTNFKNTIGEKIEVVLFHDYSYTTLSLLPDFIKYLRENNYIILPLSYQSNAINK